MSVSVNGRRFWILTLAFTLAACATAPVYEQGGYSPNVQSQSYPAFREALVRYAWSTLGTPYAWGGADLNGFDCSGLVYYIYGRAGFQVPRTTEDQLAMSMPLDVGQLKRGDLVFFDTGFWQTHVGVYIGNGQFIHAPDSGEDVMISSLKDTYWKDSLINGGSFLQE